MRLKRMGTLLVVLILAVGVSCKKKPPAAAGSSKAGDTGASDASDLPGEALKDYFVLPKQVDEIIECARYDRDFTHRAWAFNALGRGELDDQVRDVVLEGLSERSWEVLKEVIQAAVRLKITEASDRLSGLAMSENDQVRIWVNYGLICLSNQSNKGALEGHAQSQDHSVACEALEATALLDRVEGGRGGKQISVLQEKVKSEDVATRYYALVTLARLEVQDGYTGLGDFIADVAMPEDLRVKAVDLIGFTRTVSMKGNLAETYADAPESVKYAIRQAYLNMGLELESLTKPAAGSADAAAKKEE